jgi:hypothetical protein
MRPPAALAGRRRDPVLRADVAQKIFVNVVGDSFIALPCRLDLDRGRR